jgi:hypothetical protein
METRSSANSVSATSSVPSNKHSTVTYSRSFANSAIFARWVTNWYFAIFARVLNFCAIACVRSITYSSIFARYGANRGSAVLSSPSFGAVAHFGSYAFTSSTACWGIADRDVAKLAFPSCSAATSVGSDASTAVVATRFAYS